MNLYEITGNLVKVINGGMVVTDDGEILFEPEDLEQLEGEYLDKLEGCALWIKNEQAEVEALKSEEKKLAERRRIKENKIESLKDYMLRSMKDTDTSKLETSRVALSTRKSQRVIVDDEDLIPVDYLVLKQTVNKTELKKALKAGEVEGAHIEEFTNLTLK